MINNRSYKQKIYKNKISKLLLISIFESKIKYNFPLRTKLEPLV